MLRAFAGLSSVSALAFNIWIISGTSYAQIRTDGSFGPAMTLAPVGKTLTIGADLGKLMGSNLFHSFTTFNVAQGETATFTGPSSVANIVGRVTGGTSSSVNGQIASQMPGANLVLVNPSGWVFGTNASINVPGSVHISTGDAVRFSDGTSMSARTTGGSSLTVAPPAAFGFLGPNAGSIQVTGSSLSPVVGKDLSLVGGPVQITNATLSATAGKVRIVSAAGAGDVSLQDGARVATPPAKFGPVSLTNTNITVSDSSGGTTRGGIRIKGGAVTIEESSKLIARNLANANYPTVAIRGEDVALKGSQLGSAAVGSGVGGAVKVKANRSVTVGPGGTGNATILAGAFTAAATTGSIDIRSGGSIDVQPGSTIGTGTFTGQPPALISLRAHDITISGPNTGVLSSTSMDSLANAGPITLSGNTVTITDGAVVASAALGRGDSGSITISTPQLTIRNFGQVNTSTLGTGKAGDINVLSNQVLIGNGGQVSSSTFGAGNAGTVQVTGTGANSSLTIDGGDITRATGVFSNAESGSGGAAGAVTVSMDTISLVRTGQISSSTFSSGNAGQVTVNAQILSANGAGRTDFDTGVFSNANKGSNGDAGAVAVTANAVNMNAQGVISSSTFGPGQGGSVTLRTGQLFAVGSTDPNGFDTGISTNASEGTGSAGNIKVFADLINLRTNGRISSNSFTSGRGGEITIAGNKQPLALQISGSGAGVTARATGADSSGAGTIGITAGTISLMNQGEIATSAEAGGGGGIDLTAGQLIRLDRSQITTSVRGGAGNGGNIAANSRSVVLNHSQILANADAGRGGNIIINAQNYFASPDSLVQASAARGINGTIEIEAPQSNVTGTLAELPANLLTLPPLQQRGCSAVAESRGVSSLVLGSAGGLPRTGEGPQVAPYLSLLSQAPAESAANPAALSLPLLSKITPRTC
jgi:filamentous hemagglutinin family protein